MSSLGIWGRKGPFPLGSASTTPLLTALKQPLPTHNFLYLFEIKKATSKFSNNSRNTSTNPRIMKALGQEPVLWRLHTSQEPHPLLFLAEFPLPQPRTGMCWPKNPASDSFLISADVKAVLLFVPQLPWNIQRKTPPFTFTPPTNLIPAEENWIPPSHTGGLSAWGGVPGRAMAQFYSPAASFHPPPFQNTLFNSPWSICRALLKFSKPQFHEYFISEEHHHLECGAETHWAYSL